MVYFQEQLWDKEFKEGFVPEALFWIECYFVPGLLRYGRDPLIAQILCCAGIWNTQTITWPQEQNKHNKKSRSRRGSSAVKTDLWGSCEIWHRVPWSRAMNVNMNRTMSSSNQGNLGGLLVEGFLFWGCWWNLLLVLFLHHLLEAVVHSLWYNQGCWREQGSVG